MQDLAHQIYAFDEFRLDITRGALFRGDVELKLRPKSFDVLRYLTENSGRLVPKDELIQAVWRETAVTDDSLVQCLKDVRRVLSDERGQMIKTVPRRGYILQTQVRNARPLRRYSGAESGVQVVIEKIFDDDADVDPVSIVSARSSISSLAATLGSHKTASLLTVMSLVFVTVAAVLFSKPLLVWYLKAPSIAVLPIANATRNPELEYLSDGLTDSIIYSLNNLNEGGGKPPRLRVIPLNTVLAFKDRELGPREVGQRLAVDTVLASTMFDENGLRVFKFELINVDDGSLRWRGQSSVTIDRPVELLEKQNQIPGELAAQFPIRLSDADRQNLTRRYTQNPEAYEAFLRGRTNTVKITPSSLRRSIQDFQRAIDLDPNFALPYWGMGMSYYVQSSIDERPDKEANEKALDLFQHALKIDSTLTVAKDAIKANEAAMGNWEAVKRAGPAFPTYSEYLAAAGRTDEVIDDQRRRLSANPYVPLLNFRHCETLAFARHYADAITQCEKTLNLVPAADKGYFGPESPWVHLILANIYTDQGRFDAAITQGKMAVDLAEGSHAMMAMLGYFYAKAGRQHEALEIADQLNKEVETGEYVAPLNLGWLYGALGDNDKAFSWFERALAEKETKLTQLRDAPAWDSLRSDPRYADLMRRLNLPD